MDWKFSRPSNPVDYRSLLIYFIGIIFCIAGAFVVMQKIKHVEFSSSDLKADHVAAQKIWSRESIYSDSIYVNNHPPFVAVLIAPLALLPYKWAICIWSLGSILMYFFVGWSILATLKIKLSGAWSLVLIGAGLCWYPFIAHVALGQLSLLLIMLIISAWKKLREEADNTAGLLLGLAVLIKLFPALLLVYLVLRNRWKAVFVMALTVAVGLLISFLVVGYEDIYLYFTTVSQNNALSYNIFPVNFSLSGIISRIFVDGGWIQPLLISPNTALVFITGAISLTIILLIRSIQQIPRTISGNDAAYSVTIIAMLLLSPITWQHILPVLALPFGLLLLWVQTEKIPKIRQLGLLALVLISLPDIELARLLMSLYAPNRMPWHISLILMAPAVALIILWYLMLEYANWPSDKL
jgi:hypothetical protein